MTNTTNGSFQKQEEVVKMIGGIVLTFKEFQQI